MPEVLPFDSNAGPQSLPPLESCVTRYLDGLEHEAPLPGPHQPGRYVVYVGDEGKSGFLDYQGKDDRDRHVYVQRDEAFS